MATPRMETGPGNSGAGGSTIVRAALLLVVLAIFHWATLRPGHVWGDDFALYVQHARSLVEGQPYGETGYLHDAHRSGYSPAVYPPGFPALLAIPVALGDSDVPDIESLKRVMPFLCAGFLLAYLLWLRSFLPPGPALAAVAVVGLAPGLWKFRESLLSDIPFAGLLFLTLWLLGRIDRRWPVGFRPGAEALAAVALYACYATRVVGGVLVPALLLRDLLVARRLRGRTVRIAAVAVALALLQEAWLGTMAAYQADQGGATFADLPGSLFSVVGWNLLATPWRLGFFFRAGLPPVLGGALSGALLLVAAWGFLQRVREEPGRAEVFALLYGGGMTLFPFASPRYLLPLFPLVVAWLVVALREPPARLGVRARGFLRASVAALVVAATVGGYATADYGPLPSGIHEADARGLFAYARRALPPETLCVFRKPRALALLGDVRATIYPGAGAKDRTGPFLRRVGATCFVRWEAADDPHYLEYLEGRSDLEPVFVNRTFTLYLDRATKAQSSVDSLGFRRARSAVRTPLLPDSRSP